MLKISEKYFYIIVFVFAIFLRIWKLDQVPVSLYYDEVDLGYQAYSLLKTGRDYFGNFLPLQVHSYQEYRTPFNIYATIPTVAMFGVSAYGVRLPAAIFGITSIIAIFLLFRLIINLDKNIKPSQINMYSLILLLFLAISPWHIQYSRIPLEVTSFLTFFVFGLYFFFRSFKNPKFLTISLFCFLLTPWIYSTAKFFVPLFLAILALLYKKELKIYPKKVIAQSLVGVLILGLPLVYFTINGQAGSRFSYISVFTDPTVKPEVDYQRLSDAIIRQNSNNDGIVSKTSSYLVHNKFSFWGENIIKNIFQSLSTDFLFINGDTNLRHSPEGVGQLYKIEFVSLIAGMIFFYSKYQDRKIKTLLLFWILLGIIPSSITRDGAGHATRLIIIFPVFAFLVTYGFMAIFQMFKSKYVKILFVGFYGLTLLMEFFIYQHIYWTHYPTYSERSFSFGFKQVVDFAKKVESSYDKIVISTAYENPRIFLAGYYPIDPIVWQKGLKKVEVKGFGEIEGLEKFFFGQPEIGVSNERFYESIDNNVLYLASDREFKRNLSQNPGDTPKGLRLVKTFYYPSGEPVFYAFESMYNDISK